MKVEELYETGALYATTTYGYDALENLTSVAQGSQPRTFTYDSLSRLKSATNPESGTIAYNYDDNSNLTSKIDARSITTTYLYDSLNRVTSRSYTDGTPAVTYTYDALGVANSKGRLTQVSSSVSSYSYDGYDAEGKLTQSTQMTDGLAYLINYAYNLAGAMTKETYPSGRVVTTNYDAAGRLSSVVGVKDAVTTTYTSQYSYSAHGAALSLKLGNNLWEHTNFNSRLQPTQIGLGTTIMSSNTLGLDYGYGSTNNNGNILSQIITAPNFTATQNYSYDQVNRITNLTEVGVGSQSYSYDQYGNRWVSGYIPNPTLTPQSQSAYNASTNRLIACGYDAAGNMTSDQAGASFSFDGENRIKSYNSGAATYHYDGDGRRVKKVVGTVTTWFVYNASGQMIAEYESPAPSSSGGTSYLTTDYLGSTRVVTDNAGLVKTRRDYLPFGEEIAASIGGRTAAGGYGQADGIDQKFTGYERDGESGLDFAQARYYSSAQGRFTSPDPILSSAKLQTPQSWNRYTYVLNNPLAFVDPLGLEWYRKKGSGALGQPVWYDENPGDEYEEIPLHQHIYYAGEENGYVVLDPYSNNYLDGFETREDAFDVFVQRVDPPQNISFFESALEMMMFIPPLSRIGIARAGARSVEEGAARYTAREATTAAARLLLNKIAGREGERIVAEQLIAEGNKILASQVGVRTSAGIRFIDHLIQTPAGELIAVEVKSGGAVRSAAQLAKDKLMATEGAMIVSRKVPEIRGQVRVIPTIERRVNGSN